VKLPLFDRETSPTLPP